MNTLLVDVLVMATLEGWITVNQAIEILGKGNDKEVEIIKSINGN